MQAASGIRSSNASSIAIGEARNAMRLLMDVTELIRFTGVAQPAMENSVLTPAVPALCWAVADQLHGLHAQSQA